MLKLDNIVLTFPDGNSRVTAVDNLSLNVEQHQVVGVTGPSGSGKSSLLAVASCLITPDSGKVFMNGVDMLALNKKQVEEKRREEIGIVFQQANLLPSLKAWEQLVVVGDMDGKYKASALEGRALQLLDEVGLSEHVNKRPHELSGGQRQRVNICRAFMSQPSILVVDEPTSALDQERGKEIIGLIIRMTRERGAATLLVTHDQSHLPLMDEVITMVDGQRI